MPTLHELAAAVRDAKQAMKDHGEAALKAAFGEFFRQHGDVAHAIVWTQYAPHFNDGGACVFSAHAMELKLNVKARADLEGGGAIGEPAATVVDAASEATDEDEDDASESTDDEDDEDAYEYGDGGDQDLIACGWGDKREAKNDKERALLVDFNALVAAVDDDDLLEAVFGDGYKVVATAAGFSVTEYAHD